MTQYSIKNLELENFRSYLKKTSLSFGSKITLIFGKGSAGKSTIIDALQMLHASNKNDVDIFDKNSKYILSKNSNSKEFKINISCSELDDETGEINTKTINKTFSLDKKDTFFPKIVEIFSDEGKKVDQKFLSIENEPLSSSIDKDKIIKDFFISKISFIENKYAYEELFNYTLKYKDKLLINLKKCNEFRKNYNEISESVDKAKKEKKPKEAEEYEKKLKDLFKPKDEGFDDPIDAIERFLPGRFPFGKGEERIKKYEKFLNGLSSKSKYQDFIKFVSDDCKDRKRYLYKNNRVFNDYDLFIIADKKDDIIKEKLKKIYGRNIPSVGATFLEFLCFCLTDFCNMDSFLPKDIESGSFNIPKPANKDTFTWGNKPGQSKALSAREMMRMTDSIIHQTLNQIKTIRHQENLNNIIRNLSAYSISSLPASDFAEQIETNLKTINRWLGKFEFDFKISIERIGIKGEPVIMHNKGKYKIPAEIGGSGAQFLLTYLTSLIDSEESTILLEEPEKALHASLQIRLAEFFTEVANNNQLVIETHSENLLLGILKQVREKKIKPEELSVLYIYMENGISKIDKLEVNEKGGFKSKWRDGFFTEKLDLL